MSDLDALIVGGGIHGVHLAVRWIAEGKLPPERLASVDPAPQVNAGWRVPASLVFEKPGTALTQS